MISKIAKSSVEVLPLPFPCFIIQIYTEFCIFFIFYYILQPNCGILQILRFLFRCGMDLTVPAQIKI